MNQPGTPHVVVNPTTAAWIRERFGHNVNPPWLIESPELADDASS